MLSTWVIKMLSRVTEKFALCLVNVSQWRRKAINSRKIMDFINVKHFSKKLKKTQTVKKKYLFAKQDNITPHYKVNSQCRKKYKQNQPKLGKKSDIHPDLMKHHWLPLE